MSDVGFLVTKTHGANEAFVFHGAACEARTDESRFCDHALPRLLVCLLARVYNGEHLLFADTLDLGQRYGEACGLFIPLLLDGTGESLRVLLVGAVEQILRQGFGSGLGGFGCLDVAFLAGANLLLHLDLFLPALLRILLGPQSAQVLGLLTGLVALTSNAFANALVVVQPLSMLLGPAFHCSMSVLLHFFAARGCGATGSENVLYSF